jgi:hypothetical protein
MFRDISKADWRQFEKVHEVLEERFCQVALDDLASILHSMEGSAVDRYHRADKLLRNRNKELALVFDDFRRSTAVLQLMIMRRMGLLTDKELGAFSEETQQAVRSVGSLGGTGQHVSGEPPPDSAVRDASDNAKAGWKSAAPTDDAGR